MHTSSLEQFEAETLNHLKRLFQRYEITATNPEYLDALASYLPQDFFTTKTKVERYNKIFLEIKNNHEFRKILKSDWASSLVFLNYIATKAGPVYIIELKDSEFWVQMYRHEACRIFILSDHQKVTLPKKLQQQIISILYTEFYNVKKGEYLDFLGGQSLETSTIDVPSVYSVDDFQNYYNVNKQSIDQRAQAEYAKTQGRDGYRHNTVQYYLHQQKQTSNTTLPEAQTVVAQPSLIQWTRQNALSLGAVAIA
ncbi:MAG: hypothetical protein ABSF18_00875, partial [Gammaproteobacteria bacterium]